MQLFPRREGGNSVECLFSSSFSLIATSWKTYGYSNGQIEQAINKMRAKEEGLLDVFVFK